jgi:hypothetical protein
LQKCGKHLKTIKWQSIKFTKENCHLFLHPEALAINTQVLLILVDVFLFMTLTLGEHSYFFSLFVDMLFLTQLKDIEAESSSFMKVYTKVTKSKLTLLAIQEASESKRWNAELAEKWQTNVSK